MEELVLWQSDDAKSETLESFATSHLLAWKETRNTDHACTYVPLCERRIELLGNMQRFRDQGDAMCGLSDVLPLLGRHDDAVKWSTRAREVGAAHGFFTIESTACIGLGLAAIEDERYKEGLELLRNARVAAELNELDDPTYELNALESLIESLFKANAMSDEEHAMDEVESLLQRYKDMAKAESKKGEFNFAELNAYHFCARLHEVLCLLPCVWESPDLFYFGPCFMHALNMHVLKLARSAGTRRA